MRRRIRSPVTGNDAASEKLGAGGFKKPPDERCLKLGDRRCVVPQEDERGGSGLTERQDGAEVGVRRDQDSVFRGGEVEDVFVRRVVGNTLPDVEGVLPCCPEEGCKMGREGIVDQKPHEARWISRSSTALAA